MSSTAQKLEPIPQSLGLFEGYGIELEYMIVRCETLDVAPVSDSLLLRASGNYSGDADRGKAGWSNELVLHVLEMKTNGPAPQLEGLADLFSGEIRAANRFLEAHDAILMPTAMHPWMRPDVEAKLWPHANDEIYRAYDRIFGCTGHGWSNLQSMHINLPFGSAEEFGRLHAAIRLVLPIIPMLAASSPIVEGRVTGIASSRLDFYRRNQEKVKEIAGDIIPEPAFTPDEYHEQILEKTYRAIAPHDPDELMREEWLNSRGAIARFDRDAIEIRLVDTQETPRADIAIAALLCATIQSLCEERHTSFAAQKEWRVAPLASILNQAIVTGDDAVITNKGWLGEYGFAGRGPTTPRAFLEYLVDDALRAGHGGVRAYADTLGQMITSGALARRITKSLGRNAGNKARLKALYQRLVNCLANGELFDGRF